MTAKSIVLTAACAGLLLVGSMAQAQTDYVLQNYEQGGTGYVPLFGDSSYSYTIATGNNAIGIMYWSVPPVVAPGMTCRVRVKWLVWTDHVPVTYVNYFGDWNPNTELAQSAMYGGIPNPGDVFADTFSFTAPTTPGWHRIRFMWYLAYGPIPSFYGASDSVPHGFSELVFHVGYPIQGVADQHGGTPARTYTASARSVPSLFRRTTRISYNAPKTGRVELNIADESGRIVRRLSPGVQQAGHHSVQWDGRDDAGVRLPAGTYQCSVLAGGEPAMTKTVLLD
jgi:hypothetical protein